MTTSRIGTRSQSNLPTGPVVSWPPPGRRGRHQLQAAILLGIGGGAVVLVGVLILAAVLMTGSGSSDVGQDINEYSSVSAADQSPGVGGDSAYLQAQAASPT